MNRIKDKRKVPRELYDYTVPETQAYFKAHSFGLLVHKVREHYDANNISIPSDLSDVVESDYCTRYPHHCDDPDRYIPKEEQEQSDPFTQVLAAVAIPASEGLAAISKVLGIHCTGCQKRRRIIKEIRKAGISETIRRLKETFHG